MSNIDEVPELYDMLKVNTTLKEISFEKSNVTIDDDELQEAIQDNCTLNKLDGIGSVENLLTEESRQKKVSKKIIYLYIRYIVRGSITKIIYFCQTSSQSVQWNIVLAWCKEIIYLSVNYIVRKSIRK